MKYYLGIYVNFHIGKCSLRLTLQIQLAHFYVAEDLKQVNNNNMHVRSTEETFVHYMF